MEVIKVINSIKKAGGLKRYIDFIQFPYYRNIEIDTRISFDFPLTVFIGQNGCGKSSCLHALFGAPDRYTPYKFWFDTKVDPIVYYDDAKRRHSFWYSFRDSKGSIKEVIKARIKREDNPNYWETSRPLVWAGMKARKTRDSPLKKQVIYLDFRSELSAFDKYYYFGDIKNTKSKNKQEFIRKKATSLHNVLSGKVAFIKNRFGKVNQALRNLTDSELKWISFILGKQYIAGKYLEHKFYRIEGYSVIFNTNHAKYSEAFAGSGEVAIVRLVLQVLDANPFSLILLDEPEVSLHPGAQGRLQLFLLEQIKIKKHQVILTTHSPSIVKGLPKEAIKVFYQNPRNGRFLVKENLTPEEAFYHIEFPINTRKNIIVEDVLAQEIVLNVLEKMGKETKNLFNVKFNPGGETVIKKEFITVYCREKNSKDFIFFDGDQKPVAPHYDWQNFSTSDLSVNFLKGKIKEQTKVDIKFSVDSGQIGGNEQQQLDLLKSYMDYYRKNVSYLPQRTPEDIIWSDELAENLVKGVILNPSEIKIILSELTKIKETKLKFAFMSDKVQGESSADAISSIHKQFIRRWLNIENQDFKEIRNVIANIIENKE
ncbi:ATP-dependent nuclease [Lunatibacter salilacus]|uniref:ATP-dependent nuclease n=1 Tax=Lunatibacter salilacus TaxID=2483804 RepID=UPI00131C0EA1|nr:ATP-binding protein [Lunatibacter salilacus]